MTNFTDVIVLGGGAAGLFCAFTAGRRGLSVLVLDSSNKVGKKILMSGGGRCNFTNLDIQSENYLSSNLNFCKSALKVYDQWNFIDLVKNHKILYHERKHGELFCVDSSKDILRMLLDECAKVNVIIKTSCNTKNIITKKNGYEIITSKGTFCSKSLVVATGGLSIPTMGSSGFGYEIANQFSLKLLPCFAGLVPFVFSDGLKKICERLSGVSLEVSMSINKVIFRENMLFTHRGISGPVALQISSYWKLGEFITVDLLPDVNVFDLLLRYKSENTNALLRNLLSRHLPRKLVLELQELFWVKFSNCIIGKIPNATLSIISDNISNWKLKPSGTEGYRTAEVTVCGVDTNYFSSKTMECKVQPGLFFIGEVMDVTGHLGGYNFQWAWSSGYAAGCYV